MTDVFVRPRPGLILAGIPAEGAPIPAHLAEEWVANRMVVPGEPTTGIVRRLGAVVAPEPIVTEVRASTPTKAPVRRRRKAAKPARTRSRK